MQTALVSLSGGMDSVTVLAFALRRHEEVHAVGFTYGSKHNHYEQAAAEQIVKYYQRLNYNLSYQLVDLTNILGSLDSDLLQSGGAIPEGHYEEETMRRTVVPGRNILFASVLASFAMSRKDCTSVYLGVHAGDHYIYPDCRPSFIRAMRDAIHFGTGEAIDLITPFLHDTKKEILSYGYDLSVPVPYHLTRTCYKDQVIACGKCGSCQERLTAFRDLGKEDPIDYECREILEKKG